jgi:PAP2 superfamily
VVSDVARPRRSLALLPARVRAMRRPKWWQEIAFVLVCYWLYSLVRNAAPSHETSAHERALGLMGLERSMHIGVEQSINAYVATTSWLAYACNYYYATLHFIVTIAVLVWIYAKHPLRYRSIRSVLFATNLIALIGFWTFALAPPRMFASRGFVDTVVAFHTWGSYASGDLAKASNQFAAMPSLHVGWSLWCAIAIVGLAERNWVRVLGALYPVATLFVVVGTGNHYLLDAVGGAVALALGFGVQRLLSGRPAFAHPTLATLHPSELVTAH